MALLSRIFGARQDELHTPHNINHLPAGGFASVIADAINPMQRLDYQLALPAPRRKRAARHSKTYSSPAQGDRCYQLNVRVNSARRDALRRYARTNRVPLTEAVARAIDLLTAPR